MSAKHTPGPWVRVHDHPDSDARPSIAYIRRASDTARRATLDIALVYECDSSPEQDANANLIAAAADMFDLIEEALRLERNPELDNSERWEDFMKALRVHIENRADAAPARTTNQGSSQLAEETKWNS
jgi:hypothetical protein